MIQIKYVTIDKYDIIWARLNTHVLSIQHNYKQTTNTISY